jgi:Zn-dependent metalloprotease
MKRAFRISALGIAALAFGPLAVLPPADATRPGASTAAADHPAADGSRPDPAFTPAERRAAITQATRDRHATAGRLRLGAREALVVKDVLRDSDGTQHLRYHRTYAGLPVVGGDLVVHQAPSGKMSVTRADEQQIAVPSTDATVPGRTARSAAARRAGLAAGATAPVKVVFAARHRPVLAWQTTVTGAEKDGTPIHDVVYTDARTGRQLARQPQVMEATGQSLYSGDVSVATTLSGSTFQLRDSTRGGHRTYDARGSFDQTAIGTLFTDADNVWGNGTTSSRQSAAVDAAFGAAKTWDFYKAHFGRTGIRNDGVGAYSRVHFGTGYPQAFWSDLCFCVTYGDGDASLRPLPSLDVAGHEMSHGVTAATAGLDDVGEAGGLDEATSDVFGTMVEFQAAKASDPGDYYIGEMVMRDGTFIRRMDRPSLDRGSRNCWSATAATLDPHYSSGVGNHLFYLLAEGTGSKTIGGRPHSSTACNGAALTGIGRNPAAAIWYRALTAYWTSTTTYAQAANGMVKAAMDLYGVASTQCAATVNAWKGVNVTPTATCGTTAPPPIGTNLLANPGFESGATGWSRTGATITDETAATPRSGRFYAWLDGYGIAHTDWVSQPVTIPAAAGATLSFYLKVTSAETATTARDTLRVQVLSGNTTATVATYSNLDKGTGYVARSVSLAGYTGTTVTVRFLGVENSSAATSFLIDDTSLTTS